MGYKTITYDEQTERFSLGDTELTCGSCLTLLMDGINWSARVEHDGDTYYAIVFPNTGKPFKASLKQWNMGTFEGFVELDSDEGREILNEL